LSSADGDLELLRGRFERHGLHLSRLGEFRTARGSGSEVDQAGKSLWVVTDIESGIPITAKHDLGDIAALLDLPRLAFPLSWHHLGEATWGCDLKGKIVAVVSWLPGCGEQSGRANGDDRWVMVHVDDPIRDVDLETGARADRERAFERAGELVREKHDGWKYLADDVRDPHRG
jgi:hypothetical protein